MAIINIVYLQTNEEKAALHKGEHTVIWSAAPLEGCDVYAYVNAYSYRGPTKGLDVLLLHEPIVHLPGQFRVPVWEQFDKIFTWYEAVVDLGDPFVKNRVICNGPQKEQYLDKGRQYAYWQAVEAKQKAVVMINGNKGSNVPGEIYSLRKDVARWFSANSKIKFDLFGNPPFDLACYRGKLEPYEQKYFSLATYWYSIAFENIYHPVWSRGFYTERLADCFMCGTLPVYLGCYDIEKIIPSDLYIDYRQFKTLEDLDSHLNQLSEPDITAYQQRARTWMDAGNMRLFSCHYLYDQLLSLVDSSIKSDAYGVDAWLSGLAAMHEGRLWQQTTDTPTWSTTELLTMADENIINGKLPKKIVSRRSSGDIVFPVSPLPSPSGGAMIESRTESNQNVDELTRYLMDPSVNAEEQAMLNKVEPIGGWFYPSEVLGLYRLTKSTAVDARILEVGSYRGRSTNAIGIASIQTQRQIYCLDIWRDFSESGLRKADPSSGNLPPTDFGIFSDFLQQTEWLRDKIRVLKCSTEQVEDFLPEAFFDLIFVDAAHDYENAHRDIRIALKCLKPGGILCGHDYQPASAGVTQAVNELVFSLPNLLHKDVFPNTSLWFAIFPGDKETAKRSRVEKPAAVSIIIPCYNQARYLTEAVESVLAQTFTDWELLIVNDGSQDYTLALARDLAARYPDKRIRPIDKSNGGLADARNTGIRLASGKYILPMDADDKIHPQFLEKTVQILETRADIAVVYSNTIRFGDVNNSYYTGEWNLETLKKVDVVNYCSLYRREVWETTGGYNANVPGYEDWNLWIGAAEHGFMGYHLDDFLFYYRIRSGSMLAQSQSKHNEIYAQIILNHPAIYNEAERQNAARIQVEARMRQAQYYFSHGNYKKSAEWVGRALELASGDLNLLLDYGRTLLLAGETQAASLSLARTARAVPNNPTVHGLLSQALLTMEQTREAQDEAYKALKLDPKQSEALKVLEKLNIEKPAQEKENQPFSISINSAVENGPKTVNRSLSSRIMLIVHGFPPRNLFGTELYAFSMAKELMRKGYDVHVLIPNQNANIAEGTVEISEYQGIKLYSLNLGVHNDFESSFRRPIVGDWVAELIKRLEIDLVHCHHLLYFTLSALEKIPSNIPILFTAHDEWLICQQCHLMQDFQSFCTDGPENGIKCAKCLFTRLGSPDSVLEQLPGLAALFDQRLAYHRNAIQKVDVLLAPSRFLIDTLSKSGIRHPNIILAPLGMAVLKTLPHRPMKKYKFRFTIIGNIIRTKGLDIAIEAFNKLNSQKAELHIYGQVFDKPYFDQCMSQVNRYLEVKHHGGYKPEELPGILSNSDIAIVPSRSESYSLTARECLQARVPVIVSAVGGLPEAVKDGVDGLYFKSEDANDLAEKMRFFLDEPSRVEDFRQRIQPVLSIEEDAERLEKIYQNLLGTENITGDEVKITGEEKLKTILEADNVVRFIEQHKNWLDDDLLTLVRKNAMTAHQDGNSELSEGLNNLGDYIKSLLQGKISG